MGEACVSEGGVGYVKLLVGAGCVVDKCRLSSRDVGGACQE
jgi:hypothetical protein